MKSYTRLQLLASVIVFSFLLAACGSGDGKGGEDSNGEDSATASDSVTIQYRHDGSTAEAKTLADLEWMLGEWKQIKEEIVTEEKWTKESDDLFIGEGLNYPVGDEATPLLEKLWLEQNESEIYYVALPPQNEEKTYFKLTDAGETMAAFENPEHDFPRYIRYELVDGTLNVAVEGEQGIGFTLAFEKVQ